MCPPATIPKLLENQMNSTFYKSIAGERIAYGTRLFLIAKCCVILLRHASDIELVNDGYIINVNR